MTSEASPSTPAAAPIFKRVYVWELPVRISHWTNVACVPILFATGLYIANPQLSPNGEAYQHFFFHYTATPLLVVETSQLDLTGSDETLDDLLRQIRGMGRGTRYYVPRTRG